MLRLPGVGVGVDAGNKNRKILQIKGAHFTDLTSHHAAHAVTFHLNLKLFGENFSVFFSSFYRLFFSFVLFLVTFFDILKALISNMTFFLDRRYQLSYWGSNSVNSL